MFHNAPLRLFPLEDETIDGVGRALRDGRTTCASVLERCFHQIDLWDAKVNAWVYLDRAGAMKQARALDDELKSGKCRGPLHGIPFGIKDIIDVAGMPTACGFPPWRDRVAEKDAKVVRTLRDSGAVILGKTVTTQFAWIDPPPTRNPWNLDRTPGGSSSGSAAAVATGMCLGAIGTQTGGSIIRPAAFCGVAGLKPGGFDWPCEGVLPFAPTLDRVGPIGRSVIDLYLTHTYLWEDFGVRLHGKVSKTPAGIAAWVEDRRRKIHLDDAPTLLRPRGFFDRRAEPDALAAFEAALAVLVAAGATVIDLPDGAIDFDHLVRQHRTIMAAQAAATHEIRFAEHRADYAPQIRALVEEGLAVPLTRYINAQFDWRGDTDYQDVIDGLIERSDSNAIVTPAAVGPAPDTTTTGDPCFQAPWTYLGWPALTTPCGLSTNGLPLGLQIVLLPFGEPFPVALWCEDVLRRAHEPEGG